MCVSSAMLSSSSSSSSSSSRITFATLCLPLSVMMSPESQHFPADNDQTSLWIGLAAMQSSEGSKYETGKTFQKEQALEESSKQITSSISKIFL